MSDLSGMRWILGGLALRNLGRRTARTTLLVAAVSISSAIGFAGTVMTRSIESSLQVGFSRLGADLMVVSQDALANITTALLTVEPTDKTVNADLFARTAVPGIARVSMQRIVRTERSGLGDPGESIDLIGFDPENDFTVRPWIAERLGRPMNADDVIVGAARKLTLGSEIVIFGRRFRVYAKLAPTGSGTHERGVFLQTNSLFALAPAIKAQTGVMPPMLDPRRVTGFLIELASGSTELQVRFMLLAHNSNIKVIGSNSLLTGIRQGLTALVGGMVALVGLTLVSTAVLIGVLFSAIIAERRRELGLLKAIGATRGQIAGTLVVEAMVATGAGGVIGVVVGLLLLRLFEHSLVYHLTQMGLPFLWLDRIASFGVAFGCVVCASVVGGLGAALPAWRVGREDPYGLIYEES